MSPSPRFGRSSEKSEIEKAADNLAAQSRILRREATKQEEVLDRLRRLGEDFESSNAVRDDAAKKLYRESQYEIVRPLLEKANRYLEDGDAARAEARRTLDAFSGINWQAIADGLPPGHGFVTGPRPLVEVTTEDGKTVLQQPSDMFSTIDTRQRVGMLRAALRDLRENVDANDGVLRGVLREMDFTPPSYPPDAAGPDGFPLAMTNVNGWQVSEHSQFQNSVGALRKALANGSSAESIRGKLAGVKALIAAIGVDANVMGDRVANIMGDREEK